jgi:putative transposase
VAGRGSKCSADFKGEVLATIESLKVFGVSTTCAYKELNLKARTVQRWKRLNALEDLRHGPINHPKKISPAERNLIISSVTSSAFCDCPIYKIVPQLADEGKYIGSESTIYRVLREEKLLVHRGRSKERCSQSRAIPKAFASKPLELWSWDITQAKLFDRTLAYIYMTMDVFSRKIVSFGVKNSECSIFASDLIERACEAEGVLAGKLLLHADNGSSMRSTTMAYAMTALGVKLSFSRPSVSNDNPFSEALFKTLKYDQLYPSFHRFKDVEECTQWVSAFVTRYNDTLHSGISMTSPNQRHNGEDKQLLLQRAIVYDRARAQHPHRWGKKTKSFERIEQVFLNKPSAA